MNEGPISDTGEARSAAPDTVWSEEDLARLAAVDRALSDAVDLKRWLDDVDARDAYEERFDLAATFNRPDHSIGFFGAAEVGGAAMAVMGNVQEQFFDRPKIPTGSVEAQEQAADWMNRQVREFALRYFLRISDFRQPEAFPGEKPEPPPTYLRPLSWHDYSEGAETGFGFEQIYYLAKGESEPRKFSPAEKDAIVDLRRLGELYEWIVLKVHIFDFDFVLAPFGPDLPQGKVPGTEHSYLVLSPELILDDPEPEGEEIGRYGFAYAFLPATEDSLLAYGPGRFEAGLQAIHFHVRQSGEVISRMAFVANRPEKVINVSLDPVNWGLRMADAFSFGAASSVLGPVQKMWNRIPGPGGVDVVQSYIDVANRLTSGGAARNLGVSRKQLHKRFLVAHFAQHYHVIAGSLLTWRQIPDWLDTENLPRWVVSGKSA
ncbi:MAG: hypothetical protein AAF657_11880 [Acidobacteriota bacterium]